MILGLAQSGLPESLSEHIESFFPPPVPSHYKAIAGHWAVSTILRKMREGSKVSEVMEHLDHNWLTYLEIQERDYWFFRGEYWEEIYDLRIPWEVQNSFYIHERDSHTKFRPNTWEGRGEELDQARL